MINCYHKYFTAAKLMLESGVLLSWWRLIMRNNVVKIMIILFASYLLSAFSIAQAVEQNPLPQTVTSNSTTIIPPPPDIDAKAYILLDANSNVLLAEKNMNVKIQPASLTKIMTMYLVSNALANGSIKLSDNVRISKKAWQMGGSKMFVKVGTEVPLEELIKGVVIVSGNDACVALSEHTAGSEDAFVNMMNAQAQVLDLQDTQYKDCTGLSTNGHYTTAKNLAMLTRDLINKFPKDYLKWYGQKWFKYNNISQPNRNRLLWRFPGADGVKTGHTDTAGFCLVASAERNGMRLISVVVGAKSDENRSDASIRLLTYGFRFFDSRLVLPANNALARFRVYSGNKKYFSIGIDKSLYVSVPHGYIGTVKLTATVNKNLHAPITYGQVIGKVTTSLHDKIITEQELISLDNIVKGSVWRRTIDWFVSKFHALFYSRAKNSYVYNLDIGKYLQPK
jgi:D-alanyl-D-alanine carboxypeptidase (penicillin-binding protein 5/6)